MGLPCPHNDADGYAFQCRELAVRRLAATRGVRYSRSEPVLGIAGMTAIYTILVFLIVFAGLNFIEFGRLD